MTRGLREVYKRKRSGRTKVKIIPGMLNLSSNPIMSARITGMQEELGKAILTVAREVLQENLQKEKDLSLVWDDGQNNRSVSDKAGLSYTSEAADEA